jgi:uncharacterized integral membrane protein
MAYPSENRPAPTPGAEPPMPGLHPDLAPPAPASAPASVPSPDVPAGPSSTVSSDVDQTPYEAPAGDLSLTDAPVEKREKIQLARTRTSAVWLGVWAGVAGVILLIIFVAQNTASVEINFLWLSGSISLALALLIAGVAGAAVAMGVAAARIIQLRRLVRRSR